MSPTTRSDAEVRSLARSLWKGIEQGADALAPEIRTRSLDWEGQIDPDFLLSQMIAMNLLAVGDHARSMSTLILSPKLGPSSATIARGAVESLARIRWVTIGATPDEVRVRALSVLHSDVEKSAFASEFVGVEGELDRREFLALVTAQKRAINATAPSWALGTAVRDAAADAWGNVDLDEWTPYSQLSSFAHGMMPALGSLLADGRLRLPRQEVVNHAAFVLGIADRAVHVLGRCPLPLLPDGTVAQLWESIALRLEPLRRQLAEEDNGDRPFRVKG